MARNGQNPFVIGKMKPGWLVIGDAQPLPGYRVFLADPLVESIDALDATARTQCSLDVIRAGDAVLASTDAYASNTRRWTTPSRRCIRTSFRAIAANPTTSAGVQRGSATTGRPPAASIWPKTALSSIACANNWKGRLPECERLVS